MAPTLAAKSKTGSVVPGRMTPEGGALVVGRGVLHVPDERGDSVLHVILAEREPLKVDRRQRVREQERAVRVTRVEPGARGAGSKICAELWRKGS